jgi:protein SCO1/2
MNRRTYLKAVGVGGVGSSAGCLGGVFTSRPENVSLEPPEGYDPDIDLPYPGYGDPLPSVSLPAPLAGRQVTTTAFDSTSRWTTCSASGRQVTTTAFDHPTLVTFFFTSCLDVCPALVANLRAVQVDAAESGYGDQVTFLPITFDPERDTESTLRAYAERMNVNLTTGNWHFLRPLSAERTRKVVTNTFGITYQRTESTHSAYEFVHSMVILLTNAEGYVERVYRGPNPQAARIQADLRTLRRRGVS